MNGHLRVLFVVLVVASTGCIGTQTSSEDGTIPTASSTVTAATQSPNSDVPERTGVAAHTVTVVEVIDGDTLRVRYENGTRETVRLLGVDTPEVHAENTPAEYEGVPETAAGRACLRRAGEDASDYAAARLAGRTVELRFDSLAGRRGYYGRLLAYVVVDGRQFNYDLIREGHARLYDSRFRERDRYAEAEIDAREAGRGLWTCRIATATATTVTDGGSSLTVETIHADADGNDHENRNDEYVVFRNAGETDLDVSGWTVSDAAGATYRFPAGTTLSPGATLTLYTGAGTNTATAHYWDHDGAVWNNGGDTVTVRNASGDVVTRRSY